MLPKPHRLPSLEIRSVLRSGKRVTTPELQLVYRINRTPLSRFAFIVSTGIDKRATARNRIRRLLRESVHHALGSIKPGWDGVMVVKKILPSEFLSVDGMVQELFRRAGLLDAS